MNYSEQPNGEIILTLSGGDMKALMEALTTLQAANLYNPSQSISGFGAALRIGKFHEDLDNAVANAQAKDNHDEISPAQNAIFDKCLEEQDAPSGLYVLVEPLEVVTFIRKHANVWGSDHANEEHQVLLTNTLRRLVNRGLDIPLVSAAMSRIPMWSEFDEYCRPLLADGFMHDLHNLEELHSSVNALAASYLANDIAHSLLNSCAPFLLDTKVGSIENTKFWLKLD